MQVGDHVTLSTTTRGNGVMKGQAWTGGGTMIHRASTWRALARAGKNIKGDLGWVSWHTPGWEEHGGVGVHRPYTSPYTRFWQLTQGVGCCCWTPGW